LHNSNEVKKAPGRPSLLSEEQQQALDQGQAPLPEAAPLEAAAPFKRAGKLVLLGGGAVLLAGLVLGAVVWSNDAPETMTATRAKPTPTPAPLLAQVPPAAVADSANPVAPTAAPSQAAVIQDEVPAPAVANAKPAESLKQMLNAEPPPKAGADVLGKALAAASPAKPKAAPKQENPLAKLGPPPKDKHVLPAKSEADSDVTLLAALIAHTKAAVKPAAAPVPSLGKELEQCKKLGNRDAARCRIHACDGHWKKDECRVYSRPKLEKSAALT
jgi:hypothetical protein